MIKKGSRVTTPHGPGIVVAKEEFKDCRRWGVKLDDNPFSFPVAYFFKKEVSKIKQSNNQTLKQ